MSLEWSRFIFQRNKTPPGHFWMFHSRLRWIQQTSDRCDCHSVLGLNSSEYWELNAKIKSENSFFPWSTLLQIPKAFFCKTLSGDTFWCNFKQTISFWTLQPWCINTIAYHIHKISDKPRTSYKNNPKRGLNFPHISFPFPTLFL